MNNSAQVEKRSNRICGFLKIYSLVLLVLLGICATASHALESGNVFIPRGIERQPIDKNLEFLDDEDGSLTLDQIINQKSDRFAVLDPSKPLGYKYKAKALWLRFQIDLSAYAEQNWYLTYDYEHISNIKVFYPTPSGYLQKELDQNKYPAEGREAKIRDYLFKLPVARTQPSVYYVRLEPEKRYLRVGLSFAGENGIFESIQDSEFAYGLFFGGLIAMWFYNIALYLYLKDKAYLYYTYYLGCFIATFFHIYGFSPYMMRLNTGWERFFSICAYGAIHGMVLFARHFLLLKTTNKWLDHYLHFFQWVLVFGAIAVFFQPVGRPFEYLNYLILLIFPVVITSAVMRWKQGYHPARVYSFGWIVFAVALSLLSLRSIEVIPSNVISIYAIRIAAVWEAILFSIALGYRIKLIEKEKNDALEGERARLEQRVAERTESLQATLESNKMMIANASHELRTPVNALRLLLDSNTMAGGKSEKIIPRVSSIAAHMSQLVENLLLLDANRQSLTQGVVQDFDLGEEISATCKMLGPMRQGSSASFSYNVDGCRNVSVNGDLTTLRRIIINLLSNAFKFTASGTVKLEARSTADAEHGKVTCTILVQDTGIGIAPQMRERIFDAFVTSGAHAGHTGTGLGLAISRQLAQNLDGSLQLIASTPGKGSEFECTLVFKQTFKSIAKDPSQFGAVVVPLKKRLKVLLAEDDPISAEAVQLIVRLLKHEIVHVGTYASLRKALFDSGANYDVAFIDHRLPGGNGLDIIIQCRRQKIAPNTRMILMSADATLEVIESANLMCDEVITKPTTAYRIRQLLGEGMDEDAKPDKKVVDPLPLFTLRNNGVDLKNIRNMKTMFDEEVQKTLREIQQMPQLAGKSKFAGDELKPVVHRIQSACVTIGAETLKTEFSQLMNCATAQAANDQLERLHAVFDSTKNAVDEVLDQLEKKSVYES